MRVTPSLEGNYDLLTLGETLLRLSPPGQQRLDQARLFEVGVGGSELNVGCLLARLGTARRLGLQAPGRAARPHRRWRGAVARGRHPLGAVDRKCPLGLMFYEPGPLPRTSRVIYDRKHSAASELAFEDAPWESLVQASAWLHLSGITPALGPSCRALVLHLAALAAAAGKPVSYDLNYRATLTTPRKPEPRSTQIAAHLRLLVLAERDAQSVLGFQRGRRGARPRRSPHATAFRLSR